MTGWEISRKCDLVSNTLHKEKQKYKSSKLEAETNRCGRSRETSWEISQKCDSVSRAIESVKATPANGEFGDTSSFFKVMLKKILIWFSEVECISLMDLLKTQLKAFRYRAKR